LEKTLEEQQHTLQYYSQAKTKVQSKGQNMDHQEKQLIREIQQIKDKYTKLDRERELNTSVAKEYSEVLYVRSQI